LACAGNWVRQIKKFREENKILFRCQFVVHQNIVSDHSYAVLYIVRGERGIAGGKSKLTLRWTREQRGDFQERRFSRAVVPHQSDALAGTDFQRNASQGHTHTVAFLNPGKTDG
jgi:hypothetical protein